MLFVHFPHKDNKTLANHTHNSAIYGLKHACFIFLQTPGKLKHTCFMLQIAFFHETYVIHAKNSVFSAKHT